MKKRLRKKKRLGEFRELGFEITLVFDAGQTPEALDRFIDDFLENAMEANGLFFGGGGNVGTWSGIAYANAPPGRNVTLEQRETVIAWLHSDYRVRQVEASALFDLGYGLAPSEERQVVNRPEE